MLKASTVRIFNMQLRFFFFLAILSVPALQAQPLVDYSVNISLNPDERNLFIKQKVRLDSNESTKDTLYFNDWNNAYSSAKTPLAKRFAEEFDRRFYLAPKNRLGYTSISSITLNKKDLQWFRPKNHHDIIGVVLPEKRSNTPAITLEFRYRLHLPDARFSGYGFNDNDEAFQLSDWLITYTRSTGDWVSNLNIDDAQLAPAHYILKMTLPEGFQAVSDLPQRKDSLWEGDLLECPEFQIAKSIDFFVTALPMEPLCSLILITTSNNGRNPKTNLNESINFSNLNSLSKEVHTFLLRNATITKDLFMDSINYPIH